MRIAFVGKGGSGKTTLTALFTEYIKQYNKPVLVFDADLNIHMPDLLGFENIPSSKHLSHPEVTKTIKDNLKGSRTDIASMGAFRKTTPPSTASNLIFIKEISNGPLKEFVIQKGNLNLAAVGTYDEDDIGASCYHNNLAILENILSHLIDKDGYVVTDMVAGVDAFANTLHAQFDLMCLIVEPTKRSVEVYNHFLELAKEAGIEKELAVIANKVRNETDKKFINDNIPQDKLIGYLYELEYLRELDQTGEPIDISKIEAKNLELLKAIKGRLHKSDSTPQKRLEKLWDLHKTYVSQDFVTERFGDLTNQIDTCFSYDK